jgi:hypothetical protein
MTRGITLMAFGKKEYAQMAVNLALSIKAISDVAINLVTEPSTLKGIYPRMDNWLFNEIIEIDQSDLYQGGKFNPGRAKTRIYKYLKFDSNIYLDVDALCVRDLNELFDICEKTDSFYLTQIVGKHRLEQGRNFIEMQWAWADDLCRHYGISDKTDLYATNSSFSYWRKCDTAELFAEQMQHNIDFGLPLEELRLKWGGTFPDELALNATLSQFNHDATLTECLSPIYFNYGILHNFDVEKIKADHFVIGYYGGNNFTSKKLWKFYDDHLHRICRRLFAREHLYKSAKLITSKHANKTQIINGKAN